MKTTPQKTTSHKKSPLSYGLKSRKPFFEKPKGKDSLQNRHFFKQFGINSYSGMFQEKLILGQPGDKYEREADAMADQVMRMPDTPIQRDTMDFEEKNLHRNILAGSIHSLLQRQDANDTEVHDRAATSLKTGKNSGQSLPEYTRNWMESRFGTDFSHVRIHTDSQAIQMSRDLNAQAFTYGSDIYFDRGRCAPRTSAGKHLMAHELTHVVQQRGIQKIYRAVDSAHDLSSSLLAGESTLEKVYDAFVILKIGDEGEPVIRIQTGLETLGYKLPLFGVDGDFGGETRNAVIRYQRDVGLSSENVDGMVDTTTIGLMDRDLRHGAVLQDTDPKSKDKKIQKYFFSEKEPLMIFYSQGRWDPDAEEKAKLGKAVEDYGDKNWTLRGFASDEGSDAANKQLGFQRANELKKLLISEFNYQGVITIDKDAWEVGQDNINYAYFRSTKIVPGGMEQLDLDKTCPPGGAEFGSCTVIDANREEQFKKSHKKARKLLEKTIASFPINEKHAVIFDELFDSAGDSKKRKKREKLVKDRLSEMLKHHEKMLQPDLHRCGTLCHPICQAGSPAFNTDKEINPKTGKAEPNLEGIMTICPAFKTYKKDELPLILIHEGHHGTPGFKSRDEAYNDTRAIALLDFDRAMSNAATFHVFVAKINSLKTGASTIGPAFEDHFNKADNFTATEKARANEAVAWPHQWLIRSKHILSSLYNFMVKVRKGEKTYNDKEDLRDLLFNLSFHFPVQRPNEKDPSQKPGESDLIMIASMYDRTVRMTETFESSPFEFEKSGADATSWERGPGQKIRLSDHFFSSSRDLRINIILQELVHATPDISPNLEPGYVILYHEIREWLGLGP